MPPSTYARQPAATSTVSFCPSTLAHQKRSKSQIFTAEMSTSPLTMA